jgi:hypothetical protein
MNLDEIANTNGYINHQQSYRKDSNTILKGLYGEDPDKKKKNPSFEAKKTQTLVKTKDIRVQLADLSAKSGVFNDDLPLIQKNVNIKFFISSMNQEILLYP